MLHRRSIRLANPFPEQGTSNNDRYGQLWWLGGNGVYSAIGIYGQAIQIDPARDLIIVTQSAWPRATGREFSRHRTAFLEAITAALGN